jgi:mono/diheme cytochrome c family protein/Tol biopolymer transport system component
MRVMAQHDRLHTRLGRSRSVIVLGAGLALLAAAILAFWLTRPDVSTPTDGVVQITQVDDLRVTFQIDQPELGARIANILVDGARSSAAVSAVRLRFSMPAMEMAAIETDTQPVRAGHFRAQGQFFSMAGEWTVEALLLRDGQVPLRVPFVLAIAAPGEASGPLNPLPSDQPTINTGRLLYQANCAACHGTSGKGDGPAALGLRPSPGDFTQHMPPGKHTDGQVYLWIRDGYPQSAMPAWRHRLNDQQIWQLVTYLRTFGNVSQATPGGAALSTAAPQTAPATAVPAVSEPLPPLIFTREGNIWRSDGSQAAPQPITQLNADSYAEYPSFSPDGGRIAFVTTTQGPITETTPLPLPIPKTLLHVMQADGSDRKILWNPERGVLGQPVWMPDGQSVCVAIADVLSAPDAPVPDRRFQIVCVNPLTGTHQVLFEDASDLTFSPDGTRIAYMRWHPDIAAFTLNTAALDGSDEREIIGSSPFSQMPLPRFSPDGRQIIFVAIGGPATGPQGYPIAKRDPSLLDQLLGLFVPTVAEAHGATADLWSVNTDGTGLRRLTKINADAPMAVFSPDGRTIALMGAGGIYLLNADGGNLRQIDVLGDHGGLDWAR